MENTKEIDLKNIHIRYDKNILPEAVQQLYVSVGWQYREIFEIKKSLNASFLVVSAWIDETIIGFSRATGDGIYNVTIWDFAVIPEYQNKGVGSLLLNSMLTKLKDYDIPLVTLYSQLDKKNFYSKLGFECDSKKIIGMFKYNV